MNEQLSTINQRLKHLRKDILKLTQSDLGSALGLGKAAVSKMESNTSTITEQNIKLICKEFNVNYSWLVDGAGDVFVQTDDALLEALKDEYDLKDIHLKLIKEFLKLSDQEKDVFVKYLENVFLKEG